MDATPINTPAGTTVLSSIRLNGSLVYTTYQGGKTAQRFREYMGKQLIPSLEKDDVVIMDNMRSHHAKIVTELLDKAGISYMYLPPYSPDLNPIEKARSFRTLLDEYGLTQMELSETIGISRSSLANTVRLLNLDPRVIELVIQGQLTEGHARSLLCFDDPEQQYKAAKEIIEKGQNCRDIENKVKNKKKAQKRDPKYDAIIQDIEGAFQGYFGTKVRLEAGKRSGKIIIQYSSNEDLERIMDLVKNN